jgi:hypothetical protein
MSFPKIEGTALTGSADLQNLVGSLGNLVNLQTTAQRIDNNLARQQQVVPQIVANTNSLAGLTSALPPVSASPTVAGAASSGGPASSSLVPISVSPVV